MTDEQMSDDQWSEESTRAEAGEVTEATQAFPAGDEVAATRAMPPAGPPYSPHTPAAEPRILGGRYQLGKVIGRGGMAVVSQARDTRLGRDVAVKELRLDLASDPTFQTRFRREAQAAAGLNHPNIVSVYDTGEDEDPRTGVAVPYIVMELVPGRTLREILREGRPILPRRALEFTQGVLDALSYSHKAGIIHRDIKPANVMLTPTGVIKVMDFGIARAVSDTSSTMTQTAAVIGTAQYLSPEQARGETVDARSDIYSAGCLMYELLVGRPPFQGDSPVSVAYQHVRETPKAPSELDAEVTAPMDAVVLRALAKEPDARYQTAAEMRDDIGRILGGQRVKATLPPPVAPMVAAAVPPMATAMVPLTSPTSAPSATETTMTGSMEPVGERRRRAVIGWTVGILLVLVAAVAAFLLINRDTGPVTVAVPSGLLTQTQAVAEARLDEAGLEAAVTTVQGPDDATVGTVTQVNPVSGTVVPEGSVVTLTVNAGPERAEIPDGLEGLLYEEARQRLLDAGFPNVGQTPAAEDDAPADTPAGTVLSVSPSPGTSVATSAQVTLTVVMTERAAIPDGLVDMSFDDAVAALGEAGFTNVNRAVATSEPADAAPDVVTAVSPAAGEVVATSSSITLTVTTGAATVPTLRGSTFEDAAQRLADLGFTDVTTRNAAASEDLVGYVMYTEPEANSKVAKSSRVVLVVGVAGTSASPTASTPPVDSPSPEPTG
ncbi:Stk1 family PASTA domain-containing Ser/Thr kinase [Propioniciclava soli]|uniref:non-specific serine/threonine protein kinase n=2 Tax=Propioniciclava soli TaxID=2775081 RepID=A0ABZ3C5M4_9ACTN